ncbi:hypothetical protein lerEdw1_003986 [Lerista edwardsae]|nr:hypothetical protein lerEdw1_003986 [Lerista edwardsae]
MAMLLLAIESMKKVAVLPMKEVVLHTEMMNRDIDCREKSILLVVSLITGTSETACEGKASTLTMEESDPHISEILLTSGNRLSVAEILLTADLVPVSAAEVIPLTEAKSMPSINPSIAEALDKSSRLTEKELEEAASRWAAEKDKADASIIPEIPDFDARSSEQLYEHHEETGVNTTDDTELFEDSQHASRSKAISAKTKEIEQVYRQDCETFGAVVKMLIEKDPSLEKPIQFSLRQNLHEIGERCIEELKHFIAEYDATSQAFEEP